MGAGVIYLVIVGLWAAYLVPLWIRRHDDVVETRSQRSVPGARVLDREAAARAAAPAGPGWTFRGLDGTVEGGTVQAGADEDTPGDGASEDASERVDGIDELDELDAGQDEPAEEGAAVRSRRRAPRTGAALRAARRRRTLLGLLLLTTLVGVLAALGAVPAVAAAAPAVLLGAFVVHLRSQARQVAALRRRRAAATARQAARERRSAFAERTRLGMAAPADDDGQATPAAHEAAPAAADSGEAAADRVVGGWDPIPMTLPTYVTKPRADLPGRTIDLSGGGDWTSGLDQLLRSAPGRSPFDLAGDGSRAELAPVQVQVELDAVAAMADPDPLGEALDADDEESYLRRRAVGD